ncbi:MAG TPA: hypothetical protein VEK32_09875 [Thermodesulfobacteriota bacterium]|nr:hypothetical protein [Thermodesulfobacteriota bacterium]
MQKLSDCFEVGIGGGIYEAYDSYRNTSLTTNGIVSLTGSYRIYNNWATRITWDRVLTSYNRDSDVVLVGLGYEFKRGHEKGGKRWDTIELKKFEID